MYPRIIINLSKLSHNASEINKLCQENNISCMAVVKAFAGNLEIVSSLLSQGFSYLADSRIQNLQKFQHLPIQKVLLRLPMNDNISKVIKYADISLNSELKIIQKLNTEAAKQKKIHQIILMFDLGDLREGIFYLDSYLPIVEKILTLENIKLLGIGTNLTCYGGILPKQENLKELVIIKENIESTFHIHLDLISGGNSSIVYLFNQNQIPKEINNVRIGEAFLMGRETAYGNRIPNFYYDVFQLEAKIIECKVKPSFPIGEIGLNSFGEVPQIEDKGLMKRALLAIGKQDVILSNLFPQDKGIQIVGGSSDHLILDVTGTSYKVGDIILFDINYPSLVHLMNSSYVKKVIIK
ncbi:MAG: alanine/ornithine racemase family PLP-dependent enzyme [Firmicutes bacterium]|nr:alanine/ornithine racemase family PLP-dependent enzyme [Bacillota bacterium]